MTGTPRLKAPKGTCDTHMHFYDSKYPMVPTAVVRPPDASIEMYQEITRKLGIDRTVVVQPSSYGKDNRCTIESIQVLGASHALAPLHRAKGRATGAGPGRAPPSSINEFHQGGF